ncbi:DUF3306 domain-containing protein [Actibacterium ureilyticum]|uniref:DUF3306 domain-containing protein n=1 Tax=Actibacterium ureilyticum TaxID=1590614 RepID=UPI000BAAEE57|nr:DUF3306 domain-containing protein [Actibacterium ureilyticum]
MSRSDFWSRRKSAVEAEARAAAEADTATLAAQEQEALEARDDAELLAEAGLPAPEALEHPEQVQEFLRAALPNRLKTRALRQLWRLNPVLANVDGLVEYGEDFTDSATVVENLQTVYQVGKGMITRIAELAEDPAPDPVDESTEPVEPVALQPAPPVAATDAAPIPEFDEEYVTLPAQKRRMQFHFDPERGA